MLKAILLAIPLVFVLSCSKDSIDNSIKYETGTVWLSGGLYYCAQQIRLDSGDTLVVPEKTILTKTGERVSVKYKEIGVNEFCSPYIDCEIIELKSVE